jgi:hypothetical protein
MRRRIAFVARVAGLAGSALLVALCALRAPVLERGGRHAVVTYLRHLPVVRRQIPEPVAGNALTEAGAVEQAYGMKDSGVSPAVAVAQRSRPGL